MFLEISSGSGFAPVVGVEPTFLVRPERLELPTYWFEASRSIQLSYGRTRAIISRTLPEQNQTHMFPNRFLRSKTLAQRW